MQWARYNKTGKLTWFGLPNLAEKILLCALGVPFGLLGFFGLPGCDEARSQAPPVVGRYRVVQIYGVDEVGRVQWSDYASDSVKYDGPWVKFYDKKRSQWTRVSGHVLVEGGED